MTKEFRAGEKSIEQMASDYGHSVDTIKSLLFPDVKNRGKITDAIVKVAPPVRFPVKKGLTIVAGKDPKWVEAGKKAHVTKLKNLEKQENPPPEPKKEEKKKPEVIKSEEPPVEQIRQKLKELENIPMSGLNRKQRREISKQKQAMRIELGRKIYTEPTPQQVVESTIASVIKEVEQPRQKRKYTKRVKQQEPESTLNTVIPDPPPQTPDPIEQARRMQEAITYMDTVLPIEKKEAKKANVLAAEHMINSAMTLLMEAIKLLKQEE